MTDKKGLLSIVTPRTLRVLAGVIDHPELPIFAVCEIRDENPLAYEFMEAFLEGIPPDQRASPLSLMLGEYLLLDFEGSLPEVKSEILGPFREKYFRLENIGKYALDLVRRLSDGDNPRLASVIIKKSVSHADTNRQLASWVLQAGAGLYDLLENQAEADKLYRDLSKRRL